MTQNKICRREVQVNIVNVEIGKELTRPLAQLNKFCDFRKVWDKFNEDDIKKERLAKMREYYQKPEVKAKMREYHKEYYQRNKKIILSKLQKKGEHK